MASGVSLKVLLVDSSKFFRTIEKQFLAKTPVEVLEADSGEAGLQVCKDQKPDLIYLSYELNDMDGIEFCRKLKSDLGIRSIPVVMICDENSSEQIEESRKSGADSVLTKPIDRHKFSEMGRHYLPSIREPRRTCLFPIAFTVDGEAYVGKCLDISSGGLFIDFAEKFTVGKVIEMTFVLPGQKDQKIEGRASIAWYNERPNPTKPNYPLGFGVRFHEIGQTALDAIVEFTKR
jgi:CheY-like chemotaxis protein